MSGNLDKLQIIGPKRTVPQAEYILQLEAEIAELQTVVDRLNNALKTIATHKVIAAGIAVRIARGNRING